MVAKAPRSKDALPTGAGAGAHVLVIEARYYESIAEELMAGAIAELEAAGASYERVVVPGALEIPLALAQAVKADLIGSDDADARFDGCVALGCVIRGETSHYDIVCNNANHWLMELAVANGIPLGNAILTVDTEAQALERARGGRKGKGADAVRACLALVAIERVFADEDAGMSAAGKRSGKGGSKGLSRSRARLAAVQALYQMDLAETDLGDVIEEFKRQPAGRRRRGRTASARPMPSTSPRVLQGRGRAPARDRSADRPAARHRLAPGAHRLRSCAPSCARPPSS